jgi:poly(A) polymerase
VSEPSNGGPLILARPEHPVSRRNIDINAIKVLYRLHHAGFKSYLVGGAVRDLMLERRPKDFDVSTDARPQQVRRLFRNSRIIGRRFRLAHIYFRDGVVEVATFRRDPDPQTQQSDPQDLLITDDNVFGTPAEDAYRRDFTVNGLFYDVSDFSVIDWVGGIEDLGKRSIRTIGEPAIRFQEDPVRMLRACELAGRLDFTIEEAASEAIRSHRREIEKASPARLTEEISQILRSGSADAVLRWAAEMGLLDVFLPEAATLLSNADPGAGEFRGILSALDRLVQQGRDLSDAALLGTLLLPSVLVKRRDLESSGGRPIKRAALRRLIGDVVGPFAARFTLPKQRVESTEQAIWAFHRFAEPWRSVERRLRFADQPGFDDALTLLELLVMTTGEAEEELGLWRRIREKRPPRQERRRPRRRPRRRRRRRA